MKKMGIVILLGFSLLTLLMNYRNSNKIEATFSEDKSDEIYYLNTETINLTSKQVKNRFNDYNINIEKIYPSNNLDIEDNKLKLQLQSFYYINNYTDQYISILRKYGLFDEIEKILVFGIKIRVIAVKSSKEEIARLISHYENIKVVNSPEKFDFF